MHPCGSGSGIWYRFKTDKKQPGTLGKPTKKNYQNDSTSGAADLDSLKPYSGFYVTSYSHPFRLPIIGTDRKKFLFRCSTA
jgi:hypothetical protein